MRMDVLLNKNFKDPLLFIRVAGNLRKFAVSILQNTYGIHGDVVNVLRLSSLISTQCGCACIQWSLLGNSLLKRAAGGAEEREAKRRRKALDDV